MSSNKEQQPKLRGDKFAHSCSAVIGFSFFIGVYIIEPFFGNPDHAFTIVGWTIFFVLLSTVCVTLLIRTGVWYFIWLFRALQLAGFIIVAFTTPKDWYLWWAWVFSTYIGGIFATYFPTWVLTPKGTKQSSYMRTFKYRSGVILRVWSKSVVSRPQARFIYRAIAKLDGEHFSYLELWKEGTALRVAGGRNGKVVVHYSAMPDDYDSWQVLTRQSPESPFTGEQESFVVCDWEYGMPPEVLFTAAEVKAIVERFENGEGVDSGSFFWLSKDDSEPFMLVLPKFLTTYPPEQK